jgi:exodeoxyribonuclease V alpha subunit
MAAQTSAPSADDTAVSGDVVHVVYSDKETGFLVLRVRLDADSIARSPREAGESTSVVGRSSSMSAGQRVRAVGRWARGRRGLEFRADSIHPMDAVTDDGLARSLDGIAKGLGAGRARRMVSDLGGADAAIRALDHAANLANAPAGTVFDAMRWLPYQVKIDMISAWRDHRVEREVEARLASFELTPGLRARLRAKYGADAVRVVMEDPFRISREIDGVGFITADDVALKVGVGKDSIERIDAATAHVVGVAADEGGHTVCSLADVSRAMFTLFMGRTPPKPIVDDIARTVEASVQRSIVTGAIVVAPGGYAIPGLLAAERSIAAGLKHIRRDSSGEEYVPRAESGLTDEQSTAVGSVFDFGLAVITGGPGSGKTHSCREIVREANARGMDIRLCAPTARAAKRLFEATGHEATTIHRLLEAQGTGRFAKGEGNPIDADVVLADESSMVDVSLMAALISALPDGCRLVLVGDADQLPPVGPGAPFRDVIASGAVPVARLTKIHRQAEGSAIVRAAHGVLAGRAPKTSVDGDRSDGCLHVVSVSGEETPRTVLDVVLSLKTEMGVDPMDALILSPMRKGPCGVAALNTSLQALLNPPSVDVPEVEFGRGDNVRVYRLGDRVRQTKNDYGRSVVNGDVGRVCSVEASERRRKDGHPWLEVDFGDNVGVVAYGPTDLLHLVLSYCSTIHSAQGGEAPAVVLVLVDAHHVMLARTLLYTAITRARHACIVVGSPRALQTAARNAKDDARRTSLPTMLRDGDADD